MTDISTIDAHDKLVLYFENEGKDAYCYIAYDFTEKEYFICGARIDGYGEQYASFNYYCKSKKTVLEYLKFLFDTDYCKITYGLYNFYNIFGYSDCVDLELLESKRNYTCEIALYDRTVFKRKTVHNLLKMLKEIRY